MLVYPWSTSPDSSAPERVTARFLAVGVDTEVVILHELTHDAAIRDGHGEGWLGCLDGLERHLSGGTAD